MNFVVPSACLTQYNVLPTTFTTACVVELHKSPAVNSAATVEGFGEGFDDGFSTTTPLLQSNFLPDLVHV
jgi:hypothetical protein